MNTEAKTLYALVNEYKKERQDLMHDEIEYAKNHTDYCYDQSADKYHKMLGSKCNIYSKIFHIPIHTESENNNDYKIPPMICQFAKLEADLSYWKNEKYLHTPCHKPKIRSGILNDIAKKNWNTIMKKDRFAIFFLPLYKVLDQDFARRHHELTQLMIYCYKSQDSEKVSPELSRDLENLVLSIYYPEKLPDIENYKQYRIFPQ